MNIAVLSGKGGTGKTLVSVNLAAASDKANYIDCDVEEPNGALFFKPSNIKQTDTLVKIPQINHDLCASCRKCVDFCRFNAIAFVGNKPLVFEEICHSCGGCSLVCPQKAITEKDKVIGHIEEGFSDNVFINSGLLNIGQESGVPIINQLLSKIDHHNLNIIDCPPGSSCSVIESIKDADYCVLVAEPSIFGAQNLEMVYDLVKLFNKKHAVVLNKTMDIENPSENFCIEKDIPILEKIPFDQSLGKLNSDGLIAVRENSHYKNLFSSLLKKVLKEASNETVTHP